MFTITKGKIAKAQKVVIYGVEGIGKSTLASKFPDPVFIDIEGSTGNMDVARLPKPTSYEMLLQEIEYIYNTPNICKTLILDTMDWVEKYAIEHICSGAGKSDITQFGYGEGFIKLEQEIGRLLNKLSDLVEKGVNVVLTAHAIIRKFEQPDEMGAYDRYELKLGNKTTGKTAALVKEWADLVLFCNYKTYVYATDDKGQKHKAQGGQRVMYSTHHPAWDAKNRHDLPDEMPLDYSQIAFIFEGSTPAPVQIENPKSKVDSNVIFEFEDDEEQKKSKFPKMIEDLMQGSGITEENIREFWKIKGHFPENMVIENIPVDYWDMLGSHWDSLTNTFNK